MSTIKSNLKFAGVLFLTSLFTGCSGGGGGGGSTTTASVCGPAPTATLPVITVSSSISTATTWTANNVYYVNTALTVGAPLTIEPGAVVKFGSSGAGLVVYTGGSITANGNASQSIVFTSYKDDTVGGDSNGDAAATAPAVGDWGKIGLSSSSSAFNCAQFKYGGSNNSTVDVYYGYASGSNPVTITNSTFAYNNGGNSSKTISTSWDAYGALDASQAAAGSVITGNIFYGNIMPLSISGKFGVDDSNSFHKPDDATVVNKYNGIFYVGHSAKPIQGNLTFAETEVPFVFSGYLEVPDGSKLTLGDNVIIKFFEKGDSFSVNYNGNGTSKTAMLIASASPGNKIIFTSYKDDAHGGDTNGDGSASSPARGDWAYVDTYADGSIFNRAEFYYGGSSTVVSCALCLRSYSATVTNSIFAHNYGGTWTGGYVGDQGALNAGFANSQAVITGNTFFDNSIPLRISGNFSLDDSNVFHDPANTATKNDYNAIFFSGNSANYLKTITLSETEVPFALYGDLWVPAADTLTLGNNVIFKFYGTATQFTIDGAVSSGSGVVFTSFSDDSRLGDSNNDGASIGAPGDWKGVRDASHNFTIWPNTYYNACPNAPTC